MIVRDLIAVLKELDPKLKVYSQVTASNKSVRGVQVVPDGKSKSKVVLK